LKKPANSVQFHFYKPKTEKTKPNPNRKKTEQKNRAKPVFVLKNQTEPKPVGLNRFWFGFSFFFKKISVWLLFFYKKRTEPKMITHIRNPI
jgi:hypothetical protein